MDNNVKYLEYINSDSLYYEKPKYKESDDALQRMDTSKNKQYFHSFVEKYCDKIDIPGI